MANVGVRTEIKINTQGAGRSEATTRCVFIFIGENGGEAPSETDVYPFVGVYFYYISVQDYELY